MPITEGLEKEPLYNMKVTPKTGLDFFLIEASLEHRLHEISMKILPLNLDNK